MVFFNCTFYRIILGESVFLTDNLKKYIEIRALLENNNIKFKLITINTSAVWTGTGTTRGINIKKDNVTDIMYELIVARKDVEKAEFLIRGLSC